MENSYSNIQSHGEEEHNSELLKKYAFILRNIYDEVFEINITKNSYAIVFHTENKFVIPPVSGRIDKALHDISENMICPDDKKVFLAFFDIEKIMHAFNEGAKSLVTDFRKKSITGEYRWVQATVLPVDNCDDNIILCYILDINQKKSLEIQNKMISTQFIESFGSIYIDILELDLNTDTAIVIKDMNCTVNKIESYGYEKILSYFVNERIYEEDRAKICSEMSAKSLRDYFESGKKQHQIEARFTLNHSDTFEWLEISAYSVPSVCNNKKIALITTKNINEQKIMTSIVERFIYNNCDYFILIDAAHDSHTTISCNKSGSVIPSPSRTLHSDEVKQYAENCVLPEEREIFLHQTSIKRVQSELDKNGEHIFYASVNELSNIKRKKFQYVYYDKQNKMILLVCTDVTHMYNEEKRKNDLLYGALKEAETANKAKTDFLSRMSHDIRTPMNAIMGMTAIALERQDDSAKVADCLNKITASSQFLLSLINDVLDMSRIESGMMAIHENRFDFEEFLKNIYALLNPQAASRGLRFIVKPETPLAKFYIGDMLRINQIFVNLLSNAIKYNRHEGKVELLIREIEKQEAFSIIEFKISDTGYGMSHEFMQKMYEPFEQENNDAARNQIGSGLGLSIVHSLIKLMGGTIKAESKLDIGTTFTITLKLGVVNDSANIAERKDLSPVQDDIRVLVVDDDTITCEHATILLKGMGISSECATTGKSAIKRVRDATKHNIKFDAILIDWKMPVMDGMQTAIELRNILEYHSVIIIMTSYSTSDLEHTDNFSLVDMIITKPLSRKALMHVFSQVKKFPTGQPRIEVVANRLEGKNVLVVEDNLINMEIIKTMLEFKNIVVDTAENGKIAVEKFSSASNGHYDAIFMDIRMPVMNGIEATQAIRELDKPYAKAVPIIAISADAFQKDVKAALESGMNHYLVKPLEMDKLNHVLDVIF